jgi:hypothetical protein
MGTGSPMLPLELEDEQELDNKKNQDIRGPCSQKKLD